jgi:hypothetical protein
MATLVQNIYAAAQRIADLRVDMLFGDAPDYASIPEGAASSHFLIALALLEQAQNHMKLAARTLATEQETA